MRRRTQTFDDYAAFVRQILQEEADCVRISPVMQMVRVRDHHRVAGQITDVVYGVHYYAWRSGNRQQWELLEPYFSATRSGAGVSFGSKSYERDDLIMVVTADERLQELWREHPDWSFELYLGDAPAGPADLDELLRQAANLNLRPLPHPKPPEADE